MAVTVRHTFGWNMETILRPRLEEWLEEPLVKTAERFCQIDMRTVVSRNWAVELKARPSVREDGCYQDSGTFDTWMIPTCKKKPEDFEDLLIVYYWQGDNSLWYWCWDDLSARTFVAKPNKNGQMTYYIPANLFTRIG